MGGGILDLIYIKVLNKKGDFGEMRKKVLPMLLALFMFVALLPVTVHAQITRSGMTVQAFLKVACTS